MTSPEHAWNRGFLFWQLLFWASLLVGLLVTVFSALSPGVRWVSLAALLVLAVAFVGIRPRSADCLGPRNTVYLTILIAAIGVACAAQPGMSVLLTAGFSQVWMFTGPVREGIAGSVLLALAALTGMVSASGWDPSVAGTLSTVMLISLVVSIGFGVWISRIIDQSASRATLIAELSQARAELGAAHHAQGVMAERERLAREIHDTLAQGYTSVIMLAQGALASLDRSPGAAAAKLASIEEVARENLAEARALVAAFSPVALSGGTLADAISRLAERFSAETGVAVSVSHSGSLAGLSRDREVVLLRAVQESLANVRRHAKATTVTIRVAGQGSSASIEVLDNGVGFVAASASGGYGLSGMRHRVSEAGGDLAVESTPGAGTTVVVQVPL